MTDKYLDRKKPTCPFIPQTDDGLIICRCEEITKGEIRKAVYDGMYTLNEIKRFLRPGMGLCQGMTCGRLVKSIVANELKVFLSDLDDTTARAPARPVALSDFGEKDNL